MQILINGGGGSNSLIRNPLMTKDILGIRENCGCRSKDMGVQQVTPLIRNSLMTKGILGIRDNCGCRSKDMGVQIINPVIQNLIRVTYLVLCGVVEEARNCHLGRDPKRGSHSTKRSDATATVALTVIQGGDAAFPSCANGDIGDQRQLVATEAERKVAVKAWLSVVAI